MMALEAAAAVAGAAVTGTVAAGTTTARGAATEADGTAMARGVKQQQQRRWQLWELGRQPWLRQPNRPTEGA